MIECHDAGRSQSLDELPGGAVAGLGDSGPGRAGKSIFDRLPIMLRAIPPMALWRAMARRRRLMWKNSSTLWSKLSMITAPAASAVMSLFWPRVHR